jgi:hypothetical protein
LIPSPFSPFLLAAMPTLSEFPYFPIEFTKDGAVHQRAEVDALLAFLPKDATTDLLVLSHGWNNDMAEAKTLYECLLKRLRSFAPKNRKYAVLGVLWPSKKFADQAQIPSGAASKNSRTTDAALLTELKRLRGVFDTPEADKLLKEAEAQVPFLEDRQTARTKFAQLVCGVLASVAPSDTAGAEVTKPTPSADLLKKFGEPLLVKSPPAKPGAATSGQIMTIGEGAAGGHAATGQVAGLGDFFGSIKDGAMNLLNYTTYYQMKERAGTVGSKGLRPVLAELKKALPGLKLHLAGHSFGGRLVTATVSSQADFQVETLTLMQAAFSHYGLAKDYDKKGSDGFFRSLVAAHRVKGPILITHSVRDFAVGKMYPLASRLAGQVAAAIGDANDKFGGIGRNGAQATPEATAGQLLPALAAYTFPPKGILNLNADTIIQNHSDICRDEVAYAIMQAVATT